jgi:phage terminase small subunit
MPAKTPAKELPKQVLKPLEDLPRRAKIYAEYLATGCSKVEAAKQAGYSKNVANSQACQFIRETRELSYYPALFDYYQELRKERLRLFDVSVDSIVNELKIIAFSQIDNYLDLPTREAKGKLDKLREKDTELNTRLNEYAIIILKYENQLTRERKKIRKGFDELEAEQEEKLTRAEYQDAVEAAEPIRKELTKVRAKLRETEDGPGAWLRLKFKEDIPPELLPAVAEIRETREGISVKLHSKMEALDKLAKWQRMYTDQADGGEDDPGKIARVEITVNGSKSTLKIEGQEPTG